MSGIGIGLSGALPGWALTVAATPALAVVLWAYRRNRDHVSKAQLASLAALRVVLVLLLLCCLAEPVLSYRAMPKEDTPVFFLVDVSQSMSLNDTPDGRTRLDAALDPWIGDKGLLGEVARRFAVRTFAFDAGVREQDSPGALDTLDPDGEMTLIAEAISGAVSHDADLDPAALILLTDGQDQSRSDAVAVVRERGIPVYVVAVGEVETAASEHPDVAITDVVGERFMTVKAENELIVKIEQHGYTGMVLPLELRLNGEVLAAENIELADTAVEVALRFTPTMPGKQVFEVLATPSAQETITQNNRRAYAAVLGDKQLSVVYLEGTPRWEYKFVKRAFERDPAVIFTGFVRGNADEFIRQGEKVGEGRLPMADADFAGFDLIVVGDLAPSMISRGQQDAIVRAVTEHGAGFLLIGGPLSREDDGFRDTALANILPAIPSSVAQPVAGDFTPQLTADGNEHPILAGLDLIGTPLLPGCLVLERLSPGASILAAHPFEFRNAVQLPVCVVQYAGKGRSMIMAVDSTWRWRMAAPDTESGDLHARFWRQAVRWLTGQEDASLGGAPFIAYTSRDYYDAGEEAVLFARTQPSADGTVEADVAAEIRTPSGRTANTPLEFVAGSGGLYRARVPLDEPGAYEAHVTGRRDEQILGEDTATFYLGEPHREFDRVAMNESLLRAIAFESGGAFYALGDEGAIPEDLTQGATARARFVEKHIAHMPILYFALVACASVEWFYRKRRGLM